MKKAILYYRVSTIQQGKSGLGLEAQQQAVREYVKQHDIQLVREYTEIETGKNSKRPVLQKALEECQRAKLLLLIAKLDRLGRNVAFISKLMESRVDFVAVDNPYASKLVVHIMAAFAEYERDQISIRTKEALQAAKRRGVELGRNGKVLAEKNKQASVAFARAIKPVIEQLEKDGHCSIRQLVKAFNRKKVPTFSGHGKWHTNSVHRVRQQIKKME